MRNDTRLKNDKINRQSCGGILDRVNELSEQLNALKGALKLVSMPETVIKAKFESDNGEIVDLVNRELSDEDFFDGLKTLQLINGDYLHRMLALVSIAIKLDIARSELEHRYQKLRARAAAEKPKTTEKTIAIAMADRAKSGLEVLCGRLCVVIEAFFETRCKVMNGVIEMTGELYKRFLNKDGKFIRDVKLDCCDDQLVEMFIERERSIRNASSKAKWRNEDEI